MNLFSCPNPPSNITSQGLAEDVVDSFRGNGLPLLNCPPCNWARELANIEHILDKHPHTESGLVKCELCEPGDPMMLEFLREFSGSLSGTT